MIAYVDTSALVKRYVQEPGSEDVLKLFDQIETIGTAAITQVEMAAALAKAVRQKWVDAEEAGQAWQDFIGHWPAFSRLSVSTGLVDRAASLAWRHDLRANDALHLAAGLTWQELMDVKVLFACFDSRLRAAAHAERMEVWPETV